LLPKSWARDEERANVVSRGYLRRASQVSRRSQRS
jgi:hypothetical protein